jgi:hypothetical protein
LHSSTTRMRIVIETSISEEEAATE